MAGLHLEPDQGSVIFFGVDILKEELICFQGLVKLFRNAIGIGKEIEGIIGCSLLAQLACPVTGIDIINCCPEPGYGLILLAGSIEVTLAYTIVKVKVIRKICRRLRYFGSASE